MAGGYVGEVMVTGATGGIGRAVVAALVGAGHQVSAVGRDPARLRALPGVRAVTADLAQPQRLALAIGEPQRLDALVYCAGVSVEAIAPVAGTGPGRLRRRAVGAGGAGRGLSAGTG